MGRHWSCLVAHVGAKVANHERSYLQHFGDHLCEQALRRDLRFERFDLDGQDRKALADMVFTDYDYFVLVQGKNSEKDIGIPNRAG